ncbi:MAG: hypothetical protein OXN81_15430 [Alphaproteobacteria bacterium]|nr:hypothetical protein [Alphaproteobacteria bacterium]
MELDDEDDELADLEEAVMAVAWEMSQDRSMALPAVEVDERIRRSSLDEEDKDYEVAWGIRKAAGPESGRLVVVESLIGAERSKLVGTLSFLYLDRGYTMGCVAVTFGALSNLANDCANVTHAYELDAFIDAAAQGSLELSKPTLLFVTEGDLWTLQQSLSFMQLAAGNAVKVVFVGKGYEL